MRILHRLHNVPFMRLRKWKETINQHFSEWGFGKNSHATERSVLGLISTSLPPSLLPSCNVWKPMSTHNTVYHCNTGPRCFCITVWRRGDCYCSGCSVIGRCARACVCVLVGGWVGGGSATADRQLKQVNSVCGGIQEDCGLFITCSSYMCFYITHTVTFKRRMRTNRPIFRNPPRLWQHVLV